MLAQHFQCCSLKFASTAILLAIVLTVFFVDWCTCYCLPFFLITSAACSKLAYCFFPLTGVACNCLLFFLLTGAICCCLLFVSVDWYFLQLLSISFG